MGAVVYLGHLPFGFFEKQIRGFFTQFGSVGRVRVSRSKKTANSRGYAFVEFHDLECAEVVVETMDNFLLYGRLLKCEQATSSFIASLWVQYHDHRFH